MKGPLRVAFVCTGNACRSQMAEAILRGVGGARFIVSSGGTHPAGFIHPAAVKAMESMQFPMDDQYSKSWHALAADAQDVLITLCDHAAGQHCPQWAGDPIAVHWSLPDPAFHPGSDEDRLQLALQVADVLRRRLRHLAGLPVATLSREALRIELERLADQW